MLGIALFDRAGRLPVLTGAGRALLADARRPTGAVRLVPVAAPSHPLARMAAPVEAVAVRDAVQIVLSDRSTFTRGQDIAVLSLRTWRIGDLGAKHALLRAGLGRGNMPEGLAAEDLAARPRGRARHVYPLSLIHSADRFLGPAASWPAARLEAAPADARGLTAAAPPWPDPGR